MTFEERGPRFCAFLALARTEQSREDQERAAIVLGQEWDLDPAESLTELYATLIWYDPLAYGPSLD